MAKPSPANTRAADKPVWSRILVLLSCQRRERKRDSPSSPSIGMGTPCLAGVIPCNRQGLSGNGAGKKAGLFTLCDSGAAQHTSALEPLPTSTLSQKPSSHGFYILSQLCRARQCLTGVMAPEYFLLSSILSIAAPRLKAGILPREKDFFLFMSMWGFPGEHGGPS